MFVFNEESVLRNQLRPKGRFVTGMIGHGVYLTFLSIFLGNLSCSNNEYAKIEPIPSNEGVYQTGVRQKDGMIMVYVPAGEFVMGTNGKRIDRKGNSWNFTNETPKHKVYLDGYWIDRTEVTVGMFRKFVEETGYKTTAETSGGGRPYRKGPQNQEWPITPGVDWRDPLGGGSTAEDNHPITQVSWDDARAYCKWVGARLPTEAQWEKAARGTDERLFPWGNEFNGDYLNCCDARCTVVRWLNNDYDDGYEYTSPVGSYPQGASPYGVMDMAGNVWEWVADWYYEKYYERSPYKNPSGPKSGNLRAMRGGSWYDLSWVWTTVRHQNHSTDRYLDVGFRCVVPGEKN